MTRAALPQHVGLKNNMRQRVPYTKHPKGEKKNTKSHNNNNNNNNVNFDWMEKNTCSPLIDKCS